jgi:hypothetical protein
MMMLHDSYRAIVWHQGKFNGGNLQPPGALLQQHDPAAESRRLEAIFYTVYKSCTFTISPSSGYVPITGTHAHFPHKELPSEQLLDAVCSLSTVLDGIVKLRRQLASSYILSDSDAILQICSQGLVPRISSLVDKRHAAIGHRGTQRPILAGIVADVDPSRAWST